MTQTQALLLTLLIEVPFALAIAGRSWPVLAAALSASLMSHPVAWWGNETLSWPFAWRMVLIEPSVAVFETFVYVAVARVGLRRAAATSFAANATSFGFGLAIYYAIR